MLKHAETMSYSKWNWSKLCWNNVIQTIPDRSRVMIWPDISVRGNELLQGHACPKLGSKPFQSRLVPLSGCGLWPSKGTLFMYSPTIAPSLQSIRCFTERIQDSNKIIQDQDFTSTPGWRSHLCVCVCVVSRFDSAQNLKQNPVSRHYCTWMWSQSLKTTWNTSRRDKLKLFQE